jgi:hypothetical protein
MEAQLREGEAEADPAQTKNHRPERFQRRGVRLWVSAVQR